MTDEHQTLHLAAIVGSLRAPSYNRMLLRAATELAPPGVTLAEVPLGEIPFYDGDVEAAGKPAPVEALETAVAAADGLVVFTPEYNRGVPAVAKNAIDWLSRVPGDSVLSRTLVGVVAATPGRHDASGVRAHLTDSLTRTTKALFLPTLGLGSIGRAMEDGRLVDDDHQRALAAWLAEFTAFVAAGGPPPPD